MSFTIFSFGFRYGAPEADEVFDLRCLKNPYWEPELRELCSQDAPVRDFILHNEQSRTILNYALSMLLLQADLYAERGWGNDMTVGVGCKGGRHRSVVGAEFPGSYFPGFPGCLFTCL